MTEAMGWGLRQKTNERRGQAGSNRTVVVLGDSIAFGWTLDYAESYPSIVESLMNKDATGDGWRIINAGVPGDTVLMGLARYERDVQPFSPQAVIVQFGLNDGALRHTRFDAQRELVWRAQHALWAKIWFRGTRWWRRLLARIVGEDDTAVRRTSRPRVKLWVFERALDELLRRIEDDGARAFVMTLAEVPSNRVTPRQRQAYLLCDRAIRQRAVANGAILVGLSSASDRAVEEFDERSMVAADGIHLTSGGQRWVAEKVTAVLMREMI